MQAENFIMKNKRINFCLTKQNFELWSLFDFIPLER